MKPGMVFASASISSDISSYPSGASTSLDRNSTTIIDPPDYSISRTAPSSRPARKNRVRLSNHVLLRPEEQDDVGLCIYDIVPDGVSSYVGRAWFAPCVWGRPE